MSSMLPARARVVARIFQGNRISLVLGDGNDMNIRKFADWESAPRGFKGSAGVKLRQRRIHCRSTGCTCRLKSVSPDAGSSPFIRYRTNECKILMIFTAIEHIDQSCLAVFYF